MTDWAKLAAPFDASEIKERPGRGGMTFSYVDARAVMQRLDDVLTPEGWDFQSSVIPGSDIVHGKLTIGGNIREDYGYPNSDQDDEPIKAASSDALKRCAVMYGIGRHLYDDNKSHSRTSHTGNGRGTSSPRPSVTAGRGDAPLSPRPALRPVSNEPEFPDDGLLAAPQGATTARSDSEPQPGDECPIHGTEWRGDPGDLYHGPKGIVESGYCRPEGQARKPRAAGARR